MFSLLELSLFTIDEDKNENRETAGYNKNEMNRMGIINIANILSADSLAKYLGINSPIINSKIVEIIKTYTSLKPKVLTAIIENMEANDIFTILFEIKIVEKNTEGCFMK